MFIKATFTNFQKNLLSFNYGNKFYPFDHTNSHYILISLFEHAGIKKWFEYSKELNKKNCYVYSSKKYQPFSFHEGLKKVCNDKWKLIKQALQDIKNLNYSIPFTISEEFDFKQSTLNLLHRFFTYNADWSNFDSITENPFDKNFQLPKNYSKKDWFYLIDQINKHVHFLERYTIPTVNRKFVNENYPLECLYFEILEENFEKYLNFDSIEYQNNYNFLNLDYENIVTLDASILGKSILQSFMEQDDPTKKDCQGRHCSAGGFMIYTDNQLKKIYTSTQFQNWIKEYNLESSKIPYEFSIGYIQEQSTNLKDLLSQQLIKLEYID